MAFSRQCYHFEFENTFRLYFTSFCHYFAKMLKKVYLYCFESLDTRPGHLGYPKQHSFQSYLNYPKPDEIENQVPEKKLAHPALVINAVMCIAYGTTW